MKARRFNKTDWQGLLGAERFADGTDPFIVEDVEFIDSETGTKYVARLTADRYGVRLDACNNSELIELQLLTGEGWKHQPAEVFEALLNGIVSQSPVYSSSLKGMGFASV